MFYVNLQKKSSIFRGAKRPPMTPSRVYIKINYGLRGAKCSSLYKGRGHRGTVGSPTIGWKHCEYP